MVSNELNLTLVPGQRASKRVATTSRLFVEPHARRPVAPGDGWFYGEPSFKSLRERSQLIRENLSEKDLNVAEGDLPNLLLAHDDFATAVDPGGWFKSVADSDAWVLGPKLDRPPSQRLLVGV